MVSKQVVTFSWTNGAYVTIFEDGWGVDYLQELIDQYGPWDLLPVWDHYEPER